MDAMKHVKEPIADFLFDFTKEGTIVDDKLLSFVSMENLFSPSVFADLCVSFIGWRQSKMVA